MANSISTTSNKITLEIIQVTFNIGDMVLCALSTKSLFAISDDLHGKGIAE